ncbi:MAG: hypothetical protein ACOYOU_10145, partial [Kiritimatiellia bacterium]
MTDNTFPCTECAQRISRAGALSGSYVACPHCGSLVSVPKPTAAAQPDMSGYVIPPAGIWRAVPLWLIFGVGFLLCAIVLGLIYANLQRNSREQATFLDTLRAAENAETPDAGTRLITQFLEQARLDSGQKLQAHSLLALLQKRAQVDAAMAAAHRDEEARKMAAAAAEAAAR